MNVEEQVKRFQNFLEKNYKAQLAEKTRKGERYLEIDFSLLTKFDPEIAELILEDPEDLIKAFELGVEQFDINKEAKSIKIRLTNIPESQRININEIRSKHLNKLFLIEGVVRQKSDVRPQVTSAKFECPQCGNIISVLQLDSVFKEPTKCGCGRKGKFRLISKELVDAQGLTLEEPPESLEGQGQPKRMNVLLKNDLVSPISERKSAPGSKVRVIGSIKEVPITSKSGGKLTRFDLLIEANNVEASEESFYDFQISKEDEEEIKELSKDPELYKKLVDSIAPSIFGYDTIKESLLLQLMGGVRKVRKDKIVSRGDVHILLVGDPGAGKSALVRRIHDVSPKGIYVAGRGASAAGLTASVVKDEFLRGFAVEAGAMVLSSGGICCIDEMDKISEDDRAAMHEAMENQTVSISKANIQATLIARTTVLAAANPKFGRFDPYEIVAKQIDMPPTLINRFDLIFPIKDLPEEIKDNKLATHMLRLHQDPQAIEEKIPTPMLKKYIAYARQKVSPKLTDSALNEIREYYVKMRMMGSSDESSIKAVPISPRQLEALVRMAEAAARARLADKVVKKDAIRAISLLEYCLNQVGFDKETGKIDIDRITTGVSASQRSHISIVKEIINDLENKIGKTIPIEDITEEAGNKGVDSDKVDEIIERLKRAGDIFEPRHGFISRI
ncbi:AAA family ATPase [Candidatus Woesearchaeota archaeon B3_Woes]|nr:MAG: AAA family ATPase [Candidatus Woesearchaeota archaeon B3_Woes]